MNSCVFLLLFCFIQIQAVIFRLDEQQYEQMPPIVSVEPYSSCLREVGAHYCTGYVTFVADQPSALLTMMQDFSAHTASHYNHTRALYGKCLTRKCKEYYNTNETPPDLRRVLEACLNHTLSKDYNLKVKVQENITCTTDNDKPHEIEMFDVVVAAIVITLIVLNIVGSLFFIWRKKLKCTGTKLLLCFSIQRNYLFLFTTPDTNQKTEYFRCLNGIRAFLITMVVIAHSMLPIISVSASPRFVEGLYDIVPLHILFNGTVAMQTFLFMSAMLLVYNLQVHTEKASYTWRMVPLYFIKRWLRLTPSYALVVVVTATWLKYAGSGPIWHEIVVQEATDCRRYWWAHLFYINNYVSNSRCMPQACELMIRHHYESRYLTESVLFIFLLRYLASDTQLFLLALVTYKFCKDFSSRKIILSSLFIVGMILPAIYTYLRDLDGTLIISPTSVMELFYKDKNFHGLYTRCDTNICCCILGMVAGYLVYYLRKNNFDLDKYKNWRPVYWCLFPAALYIMMACKVFYEEGPRVHLVYRLMLAAFLKPVFGLLMAAFIVGAIFKMDDVCRGFLESEQFVVLGRLSYSVYLLHVALIRTLGGMLEDPIHGSFIYIVQSCLFMVVLSFILAAIFWLTVEKPLARLLDVILAPPTAKGPPKNTTPTEKKSTKM